MESHESPLWRDGILPRWVEKQIAGAGYRRMVKRGATGEGSGKIYVSRMCGNVL